MSDKKDAAIVVVGSVYKVSTLVDGGVRLTLDLPESAADIMGNLAKLQIYGVAVEVVIKPK